MLSETQEESAFLTFLGTVFSDPKVIGAETAVLTKALVPGAKEQAEQGETASASITADDADAKFVTVITKLNACTTAADGTPSLTAGAEARAALRAYMVAGALTVPPQNDVQEAMINTIDIRKSPGDITNQCKAAAGKLVKPS